MSGCVPSGRPSGVPEGEMKRQFALMTRRAAHPGIDTTL